MYVDKNGDMRSSGNAKWLFNGDPKDGSYNRWIPEGGLFGNRDIWVGGVNLKGFHIGVDYGANVGEVLTAYDDGIVLSTTGHSDYGIQCFIYFPKIGKTGHYAHMNSLYVSVGQSVKVGQAIGESGNTGTSQGAHLHFSFGNGKIINTSKGNAWEDFEKFVYPATQESKPTPSKRIIKLRGKIKMYDGYRHDTGLLSIADKEVYYIKDNQQGDMAKIDYRDGRTFWVFKKDLLLDEIKTGGFTRLYDSNGVSYGKHSVTAKTLQVLGETEDMYAVFYPTMTPSTVYIKKNDLAPRFIELKGTIPLYDANGKQHPDKSVSNKMVQVTDETDDRFEVYYGNAKYGLVWVKKIELIINL